MHAYFLAISQKVDKTLVNGMHIYAKLVKLTVVKYGFFPGRTSLVWKHQQHMPGRASLLFLRPSISSLNRGVVTEATVERKEGKRRNMIMNMLSYHIAYACNAFLCAMCLRERWKDFFLFSPSDRGDLNPDPVGILKKNLKPVGHKNITKYQVHTKKQKKRTSYMS